MSVIDKIFKIYLQTFIDKFQPWLLPNSIEILRCGLSTIFFIYVFSASKENHIKIVEESILLFNEYLDQILLDKNKFLQLNPKVAQIFVFTKKLAFVPVLSNSFSNKFDLKIYHEVLNILDKESSAETEENWWKKTLTDDINSVLPH